MAKMWKTMKMLRAKYCQGFRPKRGCDDDWFFVGFGMNALRIRLTEYIKSLRSGEEGFVPVGWARRGAGAGCANGVWTATRFARR